MQAKDVAQLIFQLQNKPDTIRLSRQDKKRFEQDFDAEHAYHSSRLEGMNGLTLDEVRKIAYTLD